MQFHSPSVLQLPVRAPDVDPEDEEDVAGAGAVVEEATGTGSTGALDEVASGTGAAATDVAAVEALSAGAEVELEEAADELEPESEPELEEPEEAVIPEPPKVGVPVQASEPSAARLALSPSYSTSSPGWGKRISTLSGVVQPLTFATNMGGKLAARFSSSAGERLEEPPETVMGAQFMYISRLPMRLNQVQARVYLPAEMPSGMVKLKE